MTRVVRGICPFQTKRISPPAFDTMRNYATEATPTSPAIDDKTLDFLDFSLVRSMIPNEGMLIAQVLP